MKPIKRLQYMMLATIVATASHKLPAMEEHVTTAEPIAAQKAAPKLTPEQQAKVAQLSNSRQAEIAAQHGSTNRVASRMSDAIFGQKVLRDNRTNQIITDQTMVDSLALQPETQVTATNGQALTFDNLSRTKDTSKTGRSISDTASNYARNLSPFAKDIKITKTLTEQNIQDSPYANYAKAGDKIVETWDTAGKLILQVKISSPDGSYKIISNQGGAKNKIVSARTADGKTITNKYSDEGVITSSIVTTPRTLNALHKNSMQTRAETTYHKNGNPEKTITFKESLVGNPLMKSDVISVKTYNQDNPLAYTLKDGIEYSASILEKRIVTKDSNSNTILTTQVPSSKGSQELKTKQIITLDANNNIASIQTFAKSESSASNKASQKLTFNPDGSISKKIVDTTGKPLQSIVMQNDQMIITTAQKDLFGNAIEGTDFTSVVNKDGKRVISGQGNLEALFTTLQATKNALQGSSSTESSTSSSTQSYPAAPANSPVASLTAYTSTENSTGSVLPPTDIATTKVRSKLQQTSNLFMNGTLLETASQDSTRVSTSNTSSTSSTGVSTSNTSSTSSTANSIEL